MPGTLEPFYRTTLISLALGAVLRHSLRECLQTPDKARRPSKWQSQDLRLRPVKASATGHLLRPPFVPLSEAA